MPNVENTRAVPYSVFDDETVPYSVLEQYRVLYGRIICTNGYCLVGIYRDLTVRKPAYSCRKRPKHKLEGSLNKPQTKGTSVRVLFS